MTDAADATIDWSVCIHPDDVPQDGRTLALIADETARRQIAELADLIELRELAADLKVRRWRSDGLAVSGHLAATVVRTCVVSLEDFESNLATDLARRFRPERQGEGTDEIVIEPETDDPPDPLPAEGVDLAAFVVEEFMLTLEPHPRKPDVEFAAPESQANGEEDTAAHPFAALESLSKKQT